MWITISLFANPDPAFYLIEDPDPIQIQARINSKNVDNFCFFSFFLQKINNKNVSQCVPLIMITSLIIIKPINNYQTNVINFTAIIFHFLLYFIPWIRISISNTDPEQGGNFSTDSCRSRSTTLIKSN